MISLQMNSGLQAKIDKAAVLVEALPYLQDFRGQTFLIKVGGSAMEDPSLVEKLVRDIVFLEVVGINPVVVHGGGKAISAAMRDAGIEPEFIGGLRKTTAEAIQVVEDTLSGVINPGLVDSFHKFGGVAEGVPGHLVFRAERMTQHPVSGDDVDLGYVGKVCDFQTDDVLSAIYREAVPVLSPLGLEEATGDRLNINADLAASALAARLKVSKLIYMSDVIGVMRDPSDEASLIDHLTVAEGEELIASGVVAGGMIPKVRSAGEALAAGVGKVHFIDGRLPHSLILEVFTDKGIGTEIVS